MGTLAKEKDIMLAEDDLDDVYIFRSALNELGFQYTLRHAENGEKLFILLKNKIPYILFLDIEMPCKDGMACIREIRQNREFDNMPVVMYTSFFTEKYIEQAYRTGANLFLAKSQSFSELVGKLKKIFALNWKEYLHFPTQDSFVIN